MKVIAIGTLLLLAAYAIAFEPLTENVVERAGVAILTEATGIGPSDALSLLRATNTEDPNEAQRDLAYDAASFTGSARELLVYESNLEKKLKQIFDGMQVPQQVQDSIPSFAGTHEKHDFLVGSSTDGKLSFSFVRFFSSGTKNGKNLFTIQSLESSCTMLEFPDTEFALVAGDETASAQSAASVRKHTVRPTLSADAIAHMWKMVTKGLVEQFFKVSESDNQI